MVAVKTLKGTCIAMYTHTGYWILSLAWSNDKYDIIKNGDMSVGVGILPEREYTHSLGGI